MTTLRPNPKRWVRFSPAWPQLAVACGICLSTVSAFRIAFGVIGQGNGIALFGVFGMVGLLLLGVVMPVTYTVLVRGKPVSSLGVGRHRLGLSLSLGAIFGLIQSTALWGYQFPDLVDWVPLLVMSLAVGLFEAIHFRGFRQNVLERVSV